MKFVLSELDRLKTPAISIQEKIQIDAEVVKAHPRCLSISDIEVNGHAYYDCETTQLVVDVQLEGVMVVPCAISLRPVDLDFSIRFSESFTFESKSAEEFESILVEGDTLDLLPYFTDTVLADIPLRVVHPDLTDYPKGDGWEVLSEEAYQEMKQHEIDPRLAILKDYTLD